MKSTPLARALVCLCVLAFSGIAAGGPDSEIEVRLIWAVKEPPAAGLKLNPVSDKEVLKHLQELPLRWSYFYEMTRTNITGVVGQNHEAALSAECIVGAKRVDANHFEISMTGKGTPVLKMIQYLPKGDILVIGGDVPNTNAWLITLKRLP
jgi:hypothetical protein